MGEIIDPRHLRLTLHSANKHTPHNCNIPLIPYLISPNLNSQHHNETQTKLKELILSFKLTDYACQNDLQEKHK